MTHSSRCSHHTHAITSRCTIALRSPRMIRCLVPIQAVTDLSTLDAEEPTMRVKDRRSSCARTCALLLLLSSARAASAQAPSPWTGVIRDDAEQEVGAFVGYSGVGLRSMSADGRFLVFQSDRTLVGGDTNGTVDIFL